MFLNPVLCGIKFSLLICELIEKFFRSILNFAVIEKKFTIHFHSFKVMFNANAYIFHYTISHNLLNSQKPLVRNFLGSPEMLFTTQIKLNLHNFAL